MLFEMALAADRGEPQDRPDNHEYEREEPKGEAYVGSD